MLYFVRNTCRLCLIGLIWLAFPPEKAFFGMLAMWILDLSLECVFDFVAYVFPPVYRSSVE